MNFYKLVERIQAGAKLAVTFTARIEELEAYPDTGMKAVVTRAWVGNDGIVKLEFDYTPFRGHNLPLEKANWWGREPGTQGTATDTGNYVPTDSIYFMGDDPVADWMSVGDHDNSLFQMYEYEYGAGLTTATSYLQWLEEKVRAA